jgi:hypothetical protein
MAENLKLVCFGKTIEREHDRRIERSDVAMPDVAGHASKEDIGVSPFEPAHYRHFGNGMALPEIFAQKKRVDAGGVAPHDYVLIIVGKNLGLDEIAWAK